jgi:hypothetical protein
LLLRGWYDHCLAYGHGEELVVLVVGHAAPFVVEVVEVVALHAEVGWVEVCSHFLTNSLYSL